MDNRDELVSFYFRIGLNYKHILACLAHTHHCIISLRTLKRILRNRGLFRRKNATDILDAAVFIQSAISTVGNNQGYRWIHLRCRQRGLTISRETVRILMQILDPEGVELRSRHCLRRRRYFAHGPNYLWHIDSYDKLKPYGLCVNGCVDGFSRQIIWLEVYKTSRNPRVIAGYYMEAITKRSGCPALMRGDMGTENGHVAQMQEFMTGQGRFLYGRSTANQRIEMFWCFLRRQCCQYWIDSLGALKDLGAFTGDYLDMNLSQFCFMNVLQNDIHDMVCVWNSHVIQRSRNQNCPSGRPMILYTLPHLYGAHDYLHEIDDDVIEVCRGECTFRGEYPCDGGIFDLCVIYMEENMWTVPKNIDEAVVLYCHLREVFHADL